MSDDMLFGVLRMPIDLAMSTDQSRTQYWFCGQEAANRIESDARLINELRKELRIAQNLNKNLNDFFK
jgi:hypothetical protein